MEYLDKTKYAPTSFGRLSQFRVTSQYGGFPNLADVYMDNHHLRIIKREDSTNSS